MKFQLVFVFKRRAVGQAVRCRPFTAEARIRIQVSPMKFVEDCVSLGQV